MDPKTQQALQLIQSYAKTKKLLTIICYAAIIIGVLNYIFHAFDKSKVIRLVTEYQKNSSQYETEKIMTNPTIKLQHNGGEIYYIKAKKAVHSDNKQGAVLYDVFATSVSGNVTAGELKIDENGDRLIFTKNPVLILNKSKK